MPSDHIRESIENARRRRRCSHRRAAGWARPIEGHRRPGSSQPLTCPEPGHHVQNRDRSRGECVNVPLQVKRPATLVPDAVKHRAPALAVTLEMAVLQFDAGSVRATQA